MKIHKINGYILANNTIVIKTRLVSTKYTSDIFEVSLITLSSTMTVLFGIVGYYGTTDSFSINSNINGNNNIEISAFQYDGYVYIAITNNNTIGYQYKIQSNNSVIEISDLTKIPTDVVTKTITW